MPHSSEGPTHHYQYVLPDSVNSAYLLTLYLKTKSFRLWAKTKIGVDLADTSHTAIESRIMYRFLKARDSACFRKLRLGMIMTLFTRWQLSYGCYTNQQF
jgi:hypothetical protein